MATAWLDVFHVDAAALAAATGATALTAASVKPHLKQFALHVVVLGAGILAILQPGHPLFSFGGYAGITVSLVPNAFEHQVSDVCAKATDGLANVAHNKSGHD